MNHDNPQHLRTAQWIHFLVGSLFCVFCYCYLWRVQGGMLAMAQHILAKGQTVYYPLVGAFVLTVVLVLLQWLLNKITQLRGEWFAVSYFPSFLTLALLTSLDASLYTGESVGNWLWAFPLALVAYGGVVWFLRSILPFSISMESDWEIKQLISNIIIFTVFAFCTCLWSLTDKTLLNQMKVEFAISHADFHGALSVGQHNRQANKTTTALRAFALAREGELGERLFNYPQHYGAEGLLVSRADSARMLYSPDSIYWYLGAYPSAQTPTALKFLRYLDLSERQRKPMAKDYLMAALLLEKRLPEFVKELAKQHPITDSIAYPKHYQEALVMYRHRYATGLSYRNPEQEANYERYQQAVRRGSTMWEAVGAAEEQFGTTFWWYFDFVQKEKQ